ncbi:unnamed protein product, partial [Owenia fusiformis]
MFGRSTTGFDRALEKATSQLLLEPDWDSILQICDHIRQNDITPKYAMNAIRKKAGHENPHVAMFALQVLESVVKNCGSGVHTEIATREYMEYMKELVKLRSDPVKAKLLELVQVWSHAFRNDPSLKMIQDTYHLMKMEGYSFPTLKESDAMFASEKAPEWKDGDCCHRCRVQFSTFQRKHHCRNCGQVFCGKCSSKNSIIPRFGIEREVRVCEACHDVLNKGSEGSKSKDDDETLPQEYLNSPLSKQPQGRVSSLQTPSTGGSSGGKTDEELREEEELQLALALSQSEAESSKAKTKNNYSLHGSQKSDNSHSNIQSNNAILNQTQVAPMMDTSDMDPELARYLNRNYWQQKQEDLKSSTVSTTTPSAPAPTATSASSEPKNTNVVSSQQTPKVQEQMQNGETENVDREQFLSALKSSVEIFVNRMNSNSTRGRSIANDSSVQTLFMTLNAMHPQLMEYVQQEEDSRAHYESLQDKLAQLRDAREALDALREDHMEKKRQEAEELERQRQIQMAHKLEIMRQKKQEYLEYQRQLALQRMQEQEREMQMRFEQQKQMTQMRQMQQYGSFQPQGYPAPGVGGYSSVEGSPQHYPQPQQGYQQPPVPPIANNQGAPGSMIMPPVGMVAPPGGQQYTPAGYTHPAGPQQPFLPQGAMAGAPPVSTASGTYQAPPGGSYQQPSQGNYQPAPAPVQQQGYTQPPQSMDYQSFNLQSMNSALPSIPSQVGQQGAFPPPGQTQ